MTAPAPAHDCTLAINGVGLYVEERGSGAPIVCIHGAGGTSLAWTGAIDKLSRLGRVIAYDRRGCARSEHPTHYERTSIAEHATTRPRCSTRSAPRRPSPGSMR